MPSCVIFFFDHRLKSFDEESEKNLVMDAQLVRQDFLRLFLLLKRKGFENFNLPFVQNLNLDLWRILILDYAVLEDWAFNLNDLQVFR